MHMPCSDLHTVVLRIEYVAGSQVKRADPS